MGPKPLGEVILSVLTHNVRYEDKNVEFLRIPFGTGISVCFLVRKCRHIVFLTDHGDG